MKKAATKTDSLTFEWNAPVRGAKKIRICDETLRDGLQSPSIQQPQITDKLEILRRMSHLGIDTVNLGIPAASRAVAEDACTLATYVARQKLPMTVQCAGRTLISDIIPIIELSQVAGIEIEICLFLGSSPIRQYLEQWNLDELKHLTETAISFAAKHSSSVMFVTEDTTRSRPEHLVELYTTAVRAGATRVCIADTVGHALPSGARRIVEFVRESLQPISKNIGIDWHGHRDRGMALASTLAAIEGGATRVHACANGLGERSGNTEMELLLPNLKLLGLYDGDLSGLREYCELVAEATGGSVHESQPVVGSDAFRTATGVHAAAIAKATAMGEHELAETVYSAIPSSMIGATQEIEIGPMSGMRNVEHWARERGLELSLDEHRMILQRAKLSSSVLTEQEIWETISPADHQNDIRLVA